jgi:hypothetical protein
MCNLTHTHWHIGNETHETMPCEQALQNGRDFCGTLHNPTPRAGCAKCKDLGYWTRVWEARLQAREKGLFEIPQWKWLSDFMATLKI